MLTITPSYIDYLQCLRQTRSGYGNRLSASQVMLITQKDVSTLLPHVDGDLVHDASNSFSQVSSVQTYNGTAAIEQVLSSAHPPYARRRLPHVRKLTAFFRPGCNIDTPEFEELIRLRQGN